MEITNKEIKDTLEILKRLSQKNNWFLIHEIQSIENVIAALDSILHYPNNDKVE